MRSLRRHLPRLLLPACVGLGAAYFVTGFVPRPTPLPLPPEELRALDLGYSEESPVRAVLERNVLDLESRPFTPPGPSALSEPPEVPAAADARKPLLAAPQVGFVPPEPSVTPAPARGRSAALPQAEASAAAGPKTANRSELKGFRLVGVIAGGERPLAMLQVDGAAVSLRPGETVRGWTLRSVRPDSVLLARGETLRRLPLGAR